MVYFDGKSESKQEKTKENSKIVEKAKKKA